MSHLSAQEDPSTSTDNLAGRGTIDMPDMPSNAVVSVSAPVIERTSSLNGLKRYDVMAKFLHQRVEQSKWLEEYHDDRWYGMSNLGAFVRRHDGSYSKTTRDVNVLQAVEALGPTVAFTMSCDTITVLLDQVSPGQKEIQFMDGSVLPVVESAADLAKDTFVVRGGHLSCLCRREHFALIWASSPPQLLAEASSLEAHLVGYIWGSSIMAPPAAALSYGSFAHSAPPPVPQIPTSYSIPRINHIASTPSDELASFSFGLDQDISLRSPPRTMAPPTHRRGSSQLRVARNRSIGSLSLRSSFEETEEDDMIAETLPPTPARSIHQTPSRRPSIKPHVSFSDPDYGHQKPKSHSGPTFDRRPSQAQHGRSYSVASRRNMSHSPAYSDGDYFETDHPLPRRISRNDSVAMRKKGSVSSTFMGEYRGSISVDVLAKMDFVEKAMEIEEQGEQDVEMQKDQKRKFMLTHAALVALAAFLVVVLDIWCIAKLVSETRLDGGYLRWCLVVTIPFFSIFSLFFMVVISGSFFQLVGPLGALQQNSFYYSAKAPKMSEHLDDVLPHITIQMPVYKEGLKGVIMPTITSVLKAVNFYERHGGTATIYVNDDGMQLISEELQEARKVYYELHDVAWCARPKQCTTPGENYFLRKGKFKKASNLNYSLHFSLRVEDEFLKLMDLRAAELECTTDDLSVEEEDELLEKARKVVQDSDGGSTWSAGDVRIGELILLIDSDTKVPEDCLLCGALEMMESPEVAIVQHSSGVMNMTGNAFENGITYFTDLIYTSITHAVGCGDVAPFVGHNAFLRWKAIQSIAFEEDDRTKFWSENHVSEDFDVSLRLQMEHFVVRMAGYHNGEFKEGVSLTVYDELARWEKYAYGCNELIFHPLIYWPTRGPITPLFKKFLFSNVKITSKFTIVAYIGTYYAIAVGFPLSIVNYVIAGLQFQLDHYYQPSWKIFVGLAVIYNILSPISFAMLRYRMGQCSYFHALGDCIKWTPLFMMFFGGLSYHLCKALTCHFFSIQIEWTTTAKELEKTGFKIGLDRVVRDFKYMYLVLIPLVAGMIYCGAYAPRGYRITDFTVVVPLANQVGCHALLPFVLGLF